MCCCYKMVLSYKEAVQAGLPIDTPANEQEWPMSYSYRLKAQDEKGAIQEAKSDAIKYGFTSFAVRMEVTSIIFEHCDDL